jgi:hypothetical protein
MTSPRISPTSRPSSITRSFVGCASMVDSAIVRLAMFFA